MKALLHSTWKGLCWYQVFIARNNQRRHSKLKGRNLPGIGLELALLAAIGGVGIGHVLLTLGVI